MAVRYILGLDLGPAADPTGLAVVERGKAEGGPTYAVRHLVRFPPGTPFPAVAAEVADATRDGGLGRPPVVCDLTAVGPTVLPVLRKAGLHVTPVALTMALDAAEVDRVWRVPTRDLVTGLQLALQQRRLKVAPDLPEADLLVRELHAFRAAVTLGSTDPAAAADWRARPGDDLVLAVALAVWWADRHPDHGPDVYAAGGSELLAFLDRLFPPQPRPAGW
ncbi:MAG TPA: hypothetical protein VM597_39510 [Gemmataceae bacterium]|nr:hypothetical protein [Gemmataceae bacterium]